MSGRILKSFSDLKDLRPESLGGLGQKNGPEAEATEPGRMNMLDVTPTPQNGKMPAAVDPVFPRSFGEHGSRSEREKTEAWIEEQVKASQKEPISMVVKLTPMLASLLLLRNDDNRPVSNTGLERAKRDIADNHWEFNGESIIIAKDGKLNDGQHRCHAVVETNRSIMVVLVFGPERKSRYTLDQGVTRTVAHYLKMQGLSYYVQLATVCSIIWTWKQLGRYSRSPEFRPTKSEALLVASQYPDIIDSISYVCKPKVSAICTPAVLAFCHWALKQRSKHETVNIFFDQLITGESLEKGSPILVCRNRLITMKSGHQIHDRIEVIFRAWNAYRLNESVSRITITGKVLPKLER